MPVPESAISIKLPGQNGSGEWWANDPIAQPQQQEGPQQAQAAQEAQPRGIRNQNPGNIEDGPFARSLPGYAGSDGRFAKFNSMDAGTNAMDALLASYGRRGIDTTAEVINRYAPASDNNPTNQYASTVARQAGFDPLDHIDLSDPATRQKLTMAMAQFENGRPLPQTQAQPQQQTANFWQNDPVANQQPRAAQPQQPAQPQVQGANTGDPERDAIINKRVEELGPSSGASTFMQGLTFGFGDELGAGISSLARGTKYDDELAAERLALNKFSKENPKTALAAEIGGGLATTPLLPGGAAIRGAGLANRIAQGMKIGAAYGGVTGIGKGEDTEDRLRGGATGLVTGAAIGAGAPAITGAVSGAGRFINSKVIEPFTSTVRGLASPNREASRRVVSALERDASNSDSGLTTREFADARAAGKPVAVADMGGETTRALARSAADTSPEGRAVLQRHTNDRFSSSKPATKKMVEQIMGGPVDAEAKIDSIREAARRQNKPAYDLFRKDTAGGIWNEDLKGVVQAPVVQNAIRVANAQAKNWAVAEGAKPPVGALLVENGRTVLRKTPNGVYHPSGQLWDYIKRALDQTGTPEAKIFAKTIRDQVDAVAPSYKLARSGAAAAFGAEDAVDAGMKFATSTMKNGEARKALAKMTPADRELFANGFAHTFIDRISEVGDRTSILNAIGKSEAARERVQIALGKDRASKLEAHLRVERVMDFLRTAVSGNSMTARRLQEMGLAGGAYGAVTGDWRDAFGAGLAYGGLRRGQQMVDQRVARKVADMLASSDTGVLKQGINIVSRSPQLMRALRSLDTQLAIGGSQESSGIKLLPPAGNAAAAADQNNKQPPVGAQVSR